LQGKEKWIANKISGMDLKSTFDIILKDLKEAREIMDKLKNYPDVPDIQIEMAKAKCRSAEEVLKFISEKDFYIESKERIPRPEASEEKSFEEKDLIRETDDKYVEETDSGVESDDDNDPGDQLEETAEANEETIDLIDDIVQPENKEDREHKPGEKDKQGKILADKFTRHSSINESMAHSRSEDKDAESGKMRPINNLSEAIGLNDRFLFIRELFNGNQELYNNTIADLNKAATIDEAYDILTQASKSNSESETFDIMLDLVKRKLRKK
jgi:hypothetical protein